MVLFGTGDVIAQQAIEKRGKNHDVGPFCSTLLEGNVLMLSGLAVRIVCQDGSVDILRREGRSEWIWN